VGSSLSPVHQKGQEREKEEEKGKGNGGEEQKGRA